jgi:hypothetical protein
MRLRLAFFILWGLLLSGTHLYASYRGLRLIDVLWPPNVTHEGMTGPSFQHK